MSDAFAKLAAGMAKEVGATAEDQDVSVWIPSGFLPLNAAISGRFDGGFPGGRIVEIFGPESSGKTWIATQAMISAQQMGGIAGFCDHERSFKLSLAKRLGLSDAEGRFFLYKPRSLEDSIKLFIKAVRFIRGAKVIEPKAPIVWVFDSLASMVPSQLLDKEVDAIKMNDNLALAKLTSTLMPVIAQVCDEYNVLAIFLNQIRTQPGVMYGDPTTTPGGKAPKFYASVRIQLGASRLMKEEGGEKVMVGSEVSGRCIKNKISRPYMVAKWRFTFREDGSGYFDVVGSLVDFAIAKEIIPSSGSRVTWTDGKSYFKSQLAKKIEAEGLLGELEALVKASGVVPDEEPEEEEIAA